MGRHVREELPEDLLHARNRFQAWRSQRHRGRIPQELWQLAVRLVSRYGLSRTASVLRLDYYSLKKHAEAATGEPPSRSPAFVELPSPLLAGKHCRFEVDYHAGLTLRVQLVGYDTADLEALVRHFGNAP
jgi:hypothetical protein